MALKRQALILGKGKNSDKMIIIGSIFSKSGYGQPKSRRPMLAVILTKEIRMLAARADQLGTETAFTVLARAAELAAQGRDIINLGISQPDFPTPDHIVEAGMCALKDARVFTPSAGSPA